MHQFNPEGYLEPYEAIASDLASCKALLVWNEARNEIWGNFEAFVSELQSILQNPFTIWLNGSFATQKEKPNDLDLVVFVEFQVYEVNISKLLQLKQKYKKLKIDSYFTPKYPQTHPNHYLYELDKKEWFLLFSHTKRDIFSGITHKKGFLELNF
jgi:hypothetical protein